MHRDISVQYEPTGCTIYFKFLSIINLYILSCDITFVLDTIRWYRIVGRNTTNNVVYYLLLRLHVSALELGHHQVPNCASEETIQCVNCNEISLQLTHCIVSSEARFETWWWSSARAETYSLSNKYYTTLLVVFRLYYPLPSYVISA